MTRDSKKRIFGIVLSIIGWGGWIIIRFGLISGRPYQGLCGAMIVLGFVLMAQRLYRTYSPNEDYPQSTFYELLILVVLAFLGIGAVFVWLLA